MKGGLIQYASAISTGLANFFALKILQHSTNDQALYSQLSTLLLSFATFQILTDLGTQTEFLRSFDKANAIRRSILAHQLLHSRLILGISVIAVAYLYSVSVNFSFEMTSAFLIYQLGFVPFAFLSVADSSFFAQFEFGKAIIARMSRLIALFSFLTTSILLEQNQFNLVGSAVASTAIFSISGLIVWFFHFRRFTQFSNLSYNTLSSKWWKSSESQSGTFIKSSAIAGIFTLLVSVQGLVAQGFLVKSIGETSLSNFNTCMAIATPAILALQTITQMETPSIARWSGLTHHEILNKLFKLALRLGLAALFMSCGLWWAHSLGFITWFFPLSNSEVLILSLIVIAAHALLNLYAPILTLCQYQNRIKPLFGVCLQLFYAAGSLNTYSHNLGQRQRY